MTVFIAIIIIFCVGISVWCAIRDARELAQEAEKEKIVCYIHKYLDKRVDNHNITIKELDNWHEVLDIIQRKYYRVL